MKSEEISAYLSYLDSDVEDAFQQIRLIDEITGDPTYNDLSEIQRRAVISGIALYIQSFYTGIEQVLKNALDKIDGITPDGDSWHAKLLKQANRKTNNRSAIISEEARDRFDDLRGFRHVVRNLYGSQLKPDRVIELMQVAREAEEVFQRDWAAFKLGFCQPEPPGKSLGRPRQ